MARKEPPVVCDRERLRRSLGMIQKRPVLLRSRVARTRALAFALASVASAQIVAGAFGSFANDGAAGGPGPAVQAVERSGSGQQQAGAAERPRVAWTGSRFEGTPDPPPPYTVVPAFPKLKF